MRRNHFKRNYSEMSDNTVETANLVAILDPDKIPEEGITAIADATGVTEDIVENLVDLVDQANDDLANGADNDTIAMNYSRKAKQLASRRSFSRKKRNFADEVNDDNLATAIELVSMVDDEALDTMKAAEIAETIAEATDVNTDAVEAVVELAQENFSRGKKLGSKSARSFSRRQRPVRRVRNYADESGIPSDEPGSIDNIEQPKQLAQDDPVNGDVNAETLSADDAGDALALQNELATVQNIKDVPDADFDRKGQYSLLKSLLGNDYVK